MDADKVNDSGSWVVLVHKSILKSSATGAENSCHLPNQWEHLWNCHFPCRICRHHWFNVDKPSRPTRHEWTLLQYQVFLTILQTQHYKFVFLKYFRHYDLKKRRYFCKEVSWGHSLCLLPHPLLKKSLWLCVLNAESVYSELVCEGCHSVSQCSHLLFRLSLGGDLSWNHTEGKRGLL